MLAYINDITLINPSKTEIAALLTGFNKLFTCFLHDVQAEQVPVANSC